MGLIKAKAKGRVLIEQSRRQEATLVDLVKDQPGRVQEADKQIVHTEPEEACSFSSR